MTMMLATTEVKDFDQFERIFSRKGAAKRRESRGEGRAGVPRSEPREPCVGLVRLGCRRVAELRVRPGSAADPKRGWAQGQAAGGCSRRTLRRITILRTLAGGCRQQCGSGPARL